MSCDTPDNTGKTPDQKPQRLNGKLRACLRTQVAAGCAVAAWRARRRVMTMIMAQ
jgi:hypothetical protein